MYYIFESTPEQQHTNDLEAKCLKPSAIPALQIKVDTLRTSEQPFSCCWDDCQNIIDYGDFYYYDINEDGFPPLFCSKECYKKFYERYGHI